ncbi:hypothetical protein M514_26660 [Trichuris suis]|uniref:Uncharacterized protein n=1 Tax=Trichuris suis TaxID=68888 RepID=A0A085MVC7_9BILA|nr:hypothetical protein M514_26660 [Trichuris suis]
MLSDARLPIRFWGEAVLTAAYLQNRLPSRSIPKTPFEHFYGHKPDVSHLRVFGSKAYSFVPTERQRKLSEKGVEGVIIGYGNTVKGYRILDSKMARVWYSRSVRIIEGPMQPWPDQMKHRQISHSKGSPKTMVNMDEWKDRPEDSSSKVFPPMEGIDGKHEQSSDKALDGSTLAPIVGLRRSERLASKDERRVRRQLCEDYIWKVVDCDPKEPATWDEMLQLPASERQNWLEAVDAGLNSLESHDVWEVANLPVGKRPISAKWVFKLKRDEHGKIHTYKARLVARGFTQIHARDYDETFAPVVRHETVQTLFAVAAIKGMHVRHIDVKTAYLNGDLDKEIFMELPPGFKQQGTEGKVLQLHRSLYGLKQSARAWNQVATKALRKIGFRPNRADPCFFSRKESGNAVTYVLLYVDDLLVASVSPELTYRVGQQLHGYFEIKDLGEVKQYLGIQVERDDGSFLLHQAGKNCQLIKA